MSELPSFDIVTTKDAITDLKPDTFSHARTTGTPKTIDELTCEVCGEGPFKAAKGLGSHKRYKHQPQLADIKDNDMIRVAYRTYQKPTYDTKSNMWLFPDSIKFPDGFRFHSIHQMDVLLHSPNGVQSGISVILVKEGKK